HREQPRPLVYAADYQLDIERVELVLREYVREERGRCFHGRRLLVLELVQFELRDHPSDERLGIAHTASYGHGYPVRELVYLVDILARDEVAHGRPPIASEHDSIFADEPDRGRAGLFRVFIEFGCIHKNHFGRTSYTFLSDNVFKCFGAPQAVPSATIFSSMRSSWLYLAVLSPLAGAPVFICPAFIPTAKSDMKQSSVSPERWLTTMFRRFSLHMRTASIASLTVPIWFTFRRRALMDCSSIALLRRTGFVTTKSSPTTWTLGSSLCSAAKAEKLSSSNGSSMLLILYVFARSM